MESLKSPLTTSETQQLVSSSFDRTVLPNGLRILTSTFKHTNAVSIMFLFGAGSRHETPELAGASHLFEHMLFKGTDKLSAFEVNEAFDSTGAQFNAFTSEESTVFYAAVLPEYLIEVSKLWIDLMRPSLSAAAMKSGVTPSMASTCWVCAFLSRGERGAKMWIRTRSTSSGIFDGLF